MSLLPKAVCDVKRDVRQNEIYKTHLHYMGTRLCCQDAWPSFLREYTSFAFGSTDTWRQLTGSVHGFQDYVNNLLRLDCSYANKWTLYIYGGKSSTGRALTSSLRGRVFESRRWHPKLLFFSNFVINKLLSVKTFPYRGLTVSYVQGIS